MGGGDDGTRTRGLRDANAALSQLSYIPTRAWALCSGGDPKVNDRRGGGAQVAKAEAIAYVCLSCGSEGLLAPAARDADGRVRCPRCGRKAAELDAPVAAATPAVANAG
jgi:DNA-directed RNA polymerase subunit RPC12/RpoP